MFLHEEEEEGGGRGGRSARDDETYEEPGTLEIIFLQPSYDALPRTKSYTVLTIFGFYSYSLQYIKLICILLYKIHIYFYQMERHTFAFALPMNIFKTTRGVLRGK